METSLDFVEVPEDKLQKKITEKFQFQFQFRLPEDAIFFDEERKEVNLDGYRKWLLSLYWRDS